MASAVGSCVVAATRGGSSTDSRLLLGPATITGSDLRRVRTAHGKGGTYTLALQVIDTRSSAGKRGPASTTRSSGPTPRSTIRS